MYVDSESTKKTQQSIFSEMCSNNEQDESIHQMLNMVCDKDMSPRKFQRDSFTKHLNFTPTA